MPLPVHWVNGERAAALAVGDRGFAYGDGVFETFRCRDGRVHLWQHHLARLRRGLGRLDIDCSTERIEEQVRQGLEFLLDNRIANAAGRLTVSRGVGERGYGGAAKTPTLVLALSGVHAWRETLPPLSIGIAELCLAEQPALAGIKHCNRLEQVLAARESRSLGWDEALMLDAGGALVCGIAGNVFAVIEGDILTPGLDRAGIAGTVRSLILDELAADCGFTVRVTSLTPADLQRADEVFMTNALWGIRHVSRCGALSFTSTGRGDTLRNSFIARCDSRGC